MYDIKDSHDFKDGNIQSVVVERGHVLIRSHCAATETGLLETQVNMNDNGWIHIHFSHTNGKMVKANQVCANGIDIRLVENK